MAEEYCWAITEAEGRSRYGRSGSIVLEFGFQLYIFLYTYAVNHLYTQFQLSPDLLGRKYCVNRAVCVLLVAFSPIKQLLVLVGYES